MRKFPLAAIAVAAGALVLGAGMPAGAGASTAERPEVIGLPDGFQPEGIEIDRGLGAFYVGSIPTGAIYRGDLRTGEGAVLVQGRSARAAIGIEVDRRGRLFVAGGPTGQAFVYDADTGEDVASYQLAEGPSFINDVVVTRDAAYFTDSVNPVIYRLPLGRGGVLPDQSDVEALPISGDLVYQAGFNVNGIAATRDGATLIVVQSNTSSLYRVNADTGVSNAIDLGGADVRNGDGLLLEGSTLYVVQNRLNQIAQVQLARNLRSGEVTALITDPDFDVPTTVASQGRRLYAVNARFTTPPSPTTSYSVVQVREP